MLELKWWTSLLESLQKTGQGHQQYRSSLKCYKTNHSVTSAWDDWPIIVGPISSKKLWPEGCHDFRGVETIWRLIASVQCQTYLFGDTMLKWPHIQLAQEHSHFQGLIPHTKRGMPLGDTFRDEHIVWFFGVQDKTGRMVVDKPVLISKLGWLNHLTLQTMRNHQSSQWNHIVTFGL